MKSTLILLPRRSHLESVKGVATKCGLLPKSVGINYHNPSLIRYSEGGEEVTMFGLLGIGDINLDILRGYICDSVVIHIDALPMITYDVLETIKLVHRGVGGLHILK